MKNKIIIIIGIISIAILCFVTYKLVVPKNFTIPQDYNLKLEKNESYIDGSDTIYYIYDNKIIAEIISYYPFGHSKGSKQHTIIIYKNINTSNINTINDIQNLIDGKNGRKVYDVYS